MKQKLENYEKLVTFNSISEKWNSWTQRFYSLGMETNLDKYC